MSAALRAAKAYLGTPYAAFGRVAAGLDCVGLVVLVARDVGVEVPDLRHYHSVASNGLLERLARETLPPTDKNEPGAILIFNLRGLEHCGIRSAPGKMIHAWRRVGRVVDSPMAESWERSLRAAFSLER